MNNLTLYQLNYIYIVRLVIIAIVWFAFLIMRDGW